jgi:hypothetical protein
MAKIIDPKASEKLMVTISGIKPPVHDFTPADEGDPREVDAFNQMIRNLRNHNPAGFTRTQ